MFGTDLAHATPPRTLPYRQPRPEPPAEKLPRWRGFNLLYLCAAGSAPPPGRVMAEHFRLFASPGFTFARLPLD